MRSLITCSLLCVLVPYPLASAAQLRPYGMVPLNDSTFMDRTEVTVADWFNYLISTQDPASPDPTVLAEVPYGYLFETGHGKKLRRVKGWGRDTRVMVWIRADSMRTRGQRYRAQRYLNYPIVGITYTQAKAYCDWRTDHLAWDMLSRENDSSSIVIGLPTIQLYVDLLSPRDSTNGRCALFNYACEPCRSQPTGRDAFISPGKEITPVGGYMPDSLGLYNMRGNAAEMTSTPGVSKGGAYLHPAYAAWPKEEQPYAAPTAWLGFRCVAQIRR